MAQALVTGALDYRVTPSNRYIQDLLNRDGMTGRGGFNLVDVDDVARGHLLAADKGRAGGRYILCGEHVEGRQLGRLIGEITGKAPIHISALRWILFIRGRFGPSSRRRSWMTMREKCTAT